MNTFTWAYGAIVACGIPAGLIVGFFLRRQDRKKQPFRLGSDLLFPLGIVLVPQMFLQGVTGAFALAGFAVVTVGTALTFRKHGQAGSAKS
ncbi:MAG TPA: hypothetical protein VGE29_02050 [Prosthecobacter sp.]